MQHCCGGSIHTEKGFINNATSEISISRHARKITSSLTIFFALIQLATSDVSQLQQNVFLIEDEEFTRLHVTKMHNTSLYQFNTSLGR
jgi:hypothetical protein